MDDSFNLNPSDAANAVLAGQRRRRQRIAKTLHDDVGQVLSAIGVELDLLRMDYASKSPDLDKRIGSIQQTLQKAFDHVRGVTYEVLPDIMDRIGIIPALERLAARARQREGGWIDIAFDSDPALSPKEAAAFYQIAEWMADEATRRSAGAKVQVTLTEDRMSITHNAVPPEENDVHWRLCLAIMQYAANEANLSFQITRHPELGTIVEVARKEQPKEEAVENAV